jgi:hypothetical protein
MAATEATLRREQTKSELLKTFPGGRSEELEVEVYNDHLEVHASRRVVALWFRHIQRCFPALEAGQQELAVVDRNGQVLLIPMRASALAAAVRLINRSLA